MDDDFEWDERKDRLNQQKHGVSFHEAQHAFLDPERVIYPDTRHSTAEPRYYCIGRMGPTDHDRSLHLPERTHPNLRRGILAQGQDSL